MKNKTTDINEFTIQKYVNSIRPDDPKILAQLDFGYSYDGKTVIFYEIRPFFENPERILNIEYAKIQFVKSKKIWKLYWRRASGKWELYEPFPEATHLEKLIEIINEDAQGCFYG
ncbi:MAG: DUF3024 domain-containing protein [Balneolaceae bacterium]